MDFSLVTQVFDSLGIPPPSKLVLLEARTLSSAHVPPYPPNMPVLLLGVASRELALHIKIVLLTTYPPDHVIQVTDHGKMMEEKLKELDEDNYSETTNWFIPSLEEGTSFEAFAEII